MDTIFSKIINREIPADIIYEDDLVLAFLDITPVNQGHTLVIPKKPFTNIFDGNPEVLAHMMKVAQKVGQALMQEKLADGINLVMNNGEAAGQEVFHAHLHVVPRITGDNAYSKPKRASCTPEDFLAVKTKMVAALAR